MKSIKLFLMIIFTAFLASSSLAQNQKKSKWDRSITTQEFNDRINNDSELKILDRKQKTNLKLFIATGVAAISYAALLQNQYGSEFSDIPIGHSIGAIGLTGFALYSGLKAGFLREKKIKLYRTKFPCDETSYIRPSSKGIGIEINF